MNDLLSKKKYYYKKNIEFYYTPIYATMFGFLKNVFLFVRSTVVKYSFELNAADMDTHSVDLNEIIVHTFEQDISQTPADIISQETLMHINLEDSYDLTHIIQPNYLISEETATMSAQYTHDDVIEYINHLSNKCLE